MSRLYDEDGIDGPFERAMDAATRDDAAARDPLCANCGHRRSHHVSGDELPPRRVPAGEGACVAPDDDDVAAGGHGLPEGINPLACGCEDFEAQS